jgi:hypothetical protein
VVPTFVVVPQSELDGKSQGDGRGEIWISANGRHVPVALRGWFRTVEGARVGGVSAELIDYTPGSSETVPFATREPRLATLPSREGKPIWMPPPSVLAARAERGIAPLDRKVEGGLWFDSNCSRNASGLLECE